MSQAMNQFLTEKSLIKQVGRWTSLTLGTGSSWLWLLRSRPDQVTKPPCEEARPLTFYCLLLVE